MHSIKWHKLIVWVVVFELVGYLLGLLTQANIDPWYRALNKSSFTPPGLVFSIVGPILYALLAFIGWRLATLKHQSPFRNIFYLFWLQMLMNWAWTPLFFEFHKLTISAIWLVSLTCLTIAIMLKTYKHDNYLALLWVPYLFWLIFATYLNIIIAMMN